MAALRRIDRERARPRSDPLKSARQINRSAGRSIDRSFVRTDQKKQNIEPSEEQSILIIILTFDLIRAAAAAAATLRYKSIITRFFVVDDWSPCVAGSN